VRGLSPEKKGENFDRKGVKKRPGELVTFGGRREFYGVKDNLGSTYKEGGKWLRGRNRGKSPKA